MPTQNPPGSFKDFIALYKDKVYSSIVSNLPRLEPEEYSNMVRVYIDRKGQYRRPSYVILSSLLYGGSDEEAILPAAVQQLTEDYFLMHDDIIDKNEMRRGGKAAHLIYGIENAIVGGDVVHAISWYVASKASKLLGPERGKRYFEKFSDILFMTHQGQYQDMKLGKKEDITKFTIEEYYSSIHAKSAYYSVYGPLQCGAIVANQPDEVLKSIEEYGTPAGNAFQIKDDILDCISTPEQLGKSIGTDIRSNTKTIILWHAVQNASSSTLEKLKEVYFKKPEEKTEEEINWVISTFKELGSIDYAEKTALSLIKESIDKFEKSTSFVKDSRLKELAKDALGNTVLRSK
ncbi:MAG: polyprenyl synthetase family protein [Candidatus Micrarchaeia archaeon]